MCLYHGYTKFLVTLGIVLYAVSDYSDQTPARPLRHRQQHQRVTNPPSRQQLTKQNGQRQQKLHRTPSQASYQSKRDFIVHEQEYFYQPEEVVGQSSDYISDDAEVEIQGGAGRGGNRGSAGDARSSRVDEEDRGQCPKVADGVGRAGGGGCESDVCVSDSDCLDAGAAAGPEASGQRCCFNGCVKTCLEAVKPAPVFDWVVEPRRKKTGHAWLLDAPEEAAPSGESCSSTRFEGESPLLCPHGFVCHIDDPGEPHAGIPDRGECVRQRDDLKDLHLHHYHMDTPTSDNETGCKIEGTEYKDDEIFNRKQHICLCSSGLVRCSVAHWNSEYEGDVFMSVREALRQYSLRDKQQMKMRKIKEYHHQYHTR